MFQTMRNITRGTPNGQFIKRWPTAPKVAFFGPPNVFLDELSQRYVISYLMIDVLLTLLLTVSDSVVSAQICD